MRLLKRLWRDPVWSAVIATSIVGVPTAASYLAGWWPSGSNLFLKFWQLLIAQMPVANWLIAIFIVSTAIAIATVALLVIEPQIQAPPEWLSYREDKFDGLKWRWSYDPLKQPMYLSTFCTHCDFQVYPHNASGFAAISRIGFVCEQCNARLGEFDTDIYSLENLIGRKIQHKLRSNTWRTSNDGRSP